MNEIIQFSYKSFIPGGPIQLFQVIYFSEAHKLPQGRWDILGYFRIRVEIGPSMKNKTKIFV